MNKGLLALNIVLLVAVGILFFLFFSKKEKGTVNTSERSSSFDTSRKWQNVPVAYFDMDSVEANFTLWKQVQDEVLKNEQTIYDSINRMKLGLQMQVQQFQEQEPKMAAEEVKRATSYFMQRDQDIKNTEKALMQEYQKYYVGKQTEIVTKIKDYCKEFNKDRRFSYIIAKEPGLFYFADTAYNITPELLKGLNTFYAKKNK
jgi:outer membrane protein